MKLLEIESLTMQFGGLTALRGVSLDFQEGMVVGIIGPNGSGKTTLFNVITGIYKPTSGEIFFEGIPITGRKPHEITKKGITRTFQNCRLFSKLTVLENVILGRQKIYGTGVHELLGFVFSRKKIERDIKKAMEIMAFFGDDLIACRNTLVSKLNHSTRRRVEICRALMAEPKLLLLDEPAAGMDAKETERLMEDIISIKKEKKGLTVAIIEHDMDVIKGISDKVIAFNNGEKIAEGKFADISRNELVKQAYLGAEDSNVAVG